MLQHRIRSPLKGTSLGHEHNGKFLFFFLFQLVYFGCSLQISFHRKFPSVVFVWLSGMAAALNRNKNITPFFPCLLLPSTTKKKKNTLSIWSKDFIVALEFSLGCLCTFHGPSQQLSLKCFQMQSCTETLQCQGSKELELLILGVHAENADFI